MMVNEREDCTDHLMVKVNQINRLIEEFKDAGESSRHLEDARLALSDIQSFIDNNKPLIPSYCLKKAVDSMKQLQLLIDKPHAKRIQFKFKPRPSNSTPEREKVVEKCQVEEKTKLEPIIVPDTTKGFSNLSNRKDLLLKGDEIKHKSINLVDLVDCDVKIANIVDTVYISGLHGTSVLVVVAARAITIADCANCSFKLVCQQLRIRSTKDCKFEVFTSARSMLESSNGLEFSKFNLDSLGPDVTRLDVQNFMDEVKFNVQQNNWTSIDDFDWLSPNVPSKNYKILTEQ